jgi:DNA repair exonuclease SbcCD ATPase subunit
MENQQPNLNSTILKMEETFEANIKEIATASEEIKIRKKEIDKEKKIIQEQIEATSTADTSERIKKLKNDLDKLEMEKTKLENLSSLNELSNKIHICENCGLVSSIKANKFTLYNEIGIPNFSNPVSIFEKHKEYFAEVDNGTLLGSTITCPNCKHKQNF